MSTDLVLPSLFDPVLPQAEKEARVALAIGQVGDVLAMLNSEQVSSVIAFCQLVEAQRLVKTTRKTLGEAQRLHVKATRREGELVKEAEAERKAEQKERDEAGRFEAALENMEPEQREAYERQQAADRKRKERARALADLSETRFEKALDTSAAKPRGATVAGTIRAAKEDEDEAEEELIAVNVRLPAHLVAKLDDYAEFRGWTRSVVMAKLLDRLVWAEGG